MIIILRIECVLISSGTSSSKIKKKNGTKAKNKAPYVIKIVEKPQKLYNTEPPQVLT